LAAGLGPELAGRWRNYRSGGAEYLDGAVTAYVPGSLIVPHNKFLINSAFVARNWFRFAVPNIGTKLKKLGFGEVDLLYFDNPYQNYISSIIQCRSSVYRMPDNAAGYDRAIPVTEELDTELVGRVDHVLYTSSGLKSKLQSLSVKRAIFFPNGVDYDHFATVKAEKPALYKTIEGPIVVYVGELEERFDFALVLSAARQLPHVTFILIGPAKSAVQILGGQANIRMTGAVSYGLLAPYLQYATVGIVPLNIRLKASLINSINPLKLYQYMAAGLPVVATGWPALQQLGTPAKLSWSAAEFISAIDSCVTQREDPNVFREFAAKHDWKTRVLELERIAAAT
jgi:glycosyltransferase involved in cell wall biosynthesis